MGSEMCIRDSNISIISQCFFPSRRGRGSAPPSQRASSPAVPVQPSFRMYDTYRKIIHVTVRMTVRIVRISRMNTAAVHQSMPLYHIIRSQNSTCVRNRDKQLYNYSTPWYAVPVYHYQYSSTDCTYIFKTCEYDRLNG